MHKSFQQYLIRIAIISMQGKTLEKGRNTENPTIEKKKKSCYPKEGDCISTMVMKIFRINNLLCECQNPRLKKLYSAIVIQRVQSNSTKRN